MVDAPFQRMSAYTFVPNNSSILLTWSRIAFCLSSDWFSLS